MINLIVKILTTVRNICESLDVQKVNTLLTYNAEFTAARLIIQKNPRTKANSFVFLIRLFSEFRGIFKLPPFVMYPLKFRFNQIPKRKFKSFFPMWLIFLPLPYKFIFKTIFIIPDLPIPATTLPPFKLPVFDIKSLIHPMSLDWVDYRGLFPKYKPFVKFFKAYFRNLRYMLRWLKKIPKGSPLYKAVVETILSLLVTLITILYTLGIAKYYKFLMQLYYRLTFTAIPSGLKRFQDGRKRLIRQLKKRYAKSPSIWVRIKIEYYTLRYKISTFFEPKK